MAEYTPEEKLQPCLLDRLTDDDPKNPEESRSQRVVSLQRYKRGVIRDLQWLLNASAHLPEEGKEQFRLSDYPHAVRSVINYGTRQLAGLTAPDMRQLEKEMTDALQIFEPRIIRQTSTVKALLERHLISFEIQGELWANPVPERLFIKTKLDMETGQCALGDRADG